MLEQETRRIRRDSEIMRKLNWKKVIAGTLSAVMLLSVTACGSANGKNESASTEATKRILQR